jgi:hypothetical protein
VVECGRGREERVEEAAGGGAGWRSLAVVR